MNQVDHHSREPGRQGIAGPHFSIVRPRILSHPDGSDILLAKLTRRPRSNPGDVEDGISTPKHFWHVSKQPAGRIASWFSSRIERAFGHFSVKSKAISHRTCHETRKTKTTTSLPLHHRTTDACRVGANRDSADRSWNPCGGHDRSYANRGVSEPGVSVQTVQQLQQRVRRPKQTRLVRQCRLVFLLRSPRRRWQARMDHDGC